MHQSSQMLPMNRDSEKFDSWQMKGNRISYIPYWFHLIYSRRYIKYYFSLIPDTSLSPQWKLFLLPDFFSDTAKLMEHPSL